jgi:excisionase family DNA binding protein
MKKPQPPTEGSLPPLVSPGQCAAHVGMDIKTIYRRIEDGTLPAVRFGPRCIRVRREDLLKLLTPSTFEGSHYAASKKG